MKSSLHWEKWGKTDPYYGVLSSDLYAKENLTEQSYKQFFKSGEEHLDFILNVIDKKFGLDNKFADALDFGCGVGRIAIPMAQKYGRVVAVDVSMSMLEELRNNCKKKGIENIEPEISGNGLAKIRGPFDFIHSHIVFQHINPSIGFDIVSNLLNKLRPGGTAALHFTYYREVSCRRKFFCWLQSKSLLVCKIVNIIKRRDFNTPHMEMNDYNLNKLFSLIQSNDFKDAYVHFTSDQGHFGLILFLKKV